MLLFRLRRRRTAPRVLILTDHVQSRSAVFLIQLRPTLPLLLSRHPGRPGGVLLRVLLVLSRHFPMPQQRRPWLA